MQILKKIPISVVKYICVGLISVTVDYSLLLLFYRIPSVPLEAATAAAFIIGLVVNFLLSRAWSFKAAGDRRSTVRQIILYGVLILINTGFTVFIVGYAANHLHILPEISKPICVLCTTVWNYILYKEVIFKQTDKTIV